MKRPANSRYIAPADGNWQAFEDANFVVGDSPATLDVNDTLAMNGRDGYLVCDGTGSIQVEISKNGSTYGDAFTVKEGEVINFQGGDVDTIRITHLGTDSAYRALLL